MAGRDVLDVIEREIADEARTRFPGDAVQRVRLQFPASYNPYEVCVAVTDHQTTARGLVQHNIDLFVAAS